MGRTWGQEVCLCLRFSYRETEKDRKTAGPKKDLKNKRISNGIRRRKHPTSYRENRDTENIRS